jgi:hypothetical protein
MKTKLVTTVQITDNTGSGDFPADGSFSESLVSSLTDGAGDDKAQIVFADTRTLAGSATEDLDLAGSLKDNFNKTLTFTKVKAIFVQADADNAEAIEIGPASANGFLGPWADASDVTKIDDSGAFMVTAPKTGWTVTAGTVDLITVTAGASGGSYTIVIVGEGTSA